MKYNLSIVFAVSIVLFAFYGITPVKSQSVSTIQINSNPEFRREISPYIYGLNPYHYNPNATGLNIHASNINPTALRFGGDAMSSYNWEINRSTSNNACGDGSSYFNNYNGSFAPYVSGQLGIEFNQPAGAKLKLAEDAHSIGAYPLVQISALKHVSSANMGCLVSMASGDRFKNVVIEKPGGNLSLNPDINDNFVYADEEVNYLISQLGNSQSQTGIKGYCLENEPALWKHTHPYVYPANEYPTLGEILETNIELAKRIKALDPNAETFGLGAYGLVEYFHGVQDYPAADYDTYMTDIPGYHHINHKYMRWLAAYLHQMKLASDDVGIRLLDALDLHFYNSGDNLLHDARSFWDPTYVENSWISDYIYINQPYNAATAFHKIIDDFYPDTKLSVSEWGMFDNTMEAGIYIADMLGGFGVKDVYLATYFGALNGYLAGAFNIYTNYDGINIIM